MSTCVHAEMRLSETVVLDKKGRVTGAQLNQTNEISLGSYSGNNERFIAWADEGKMRISPKVAHGTTLRVFAGKWCQGMVKMIRNQL
jgi:hypothetical protein